MPTSLKGGATLAVVGIQIPKSTDKDSVLLAYHQAVKRITPAHAGDVLYCPPMFILVLSLSMIAGCATIEQPGQPSVMPEGIAGRAISQPEPVMSQDHMEAILLWTPDGPSPSAEQWLTARGFRTMPMRAGLLVMGDRETFERAFGVRLVGSELPTTLPVPAPLQDTVATISIRRPPDYHPGG